MAGGATQALWLRPSGGRVFALALVPRAGRWGWWGFGFVRLAGWFQGGCSEGWDGSGFAVDREGNTL